MSYSYFVIKDFPIAYYKFDSLGEDLEDSSGFDNHGKSYDLVGYVYSFFENLAGTLLNNLSENDEYALIDLEDDEIPPGFVNLDGEIVEVQ